MPPIIACRAGYEAVSTLHTYGWALLRVQFLIIGVQKAGTTALFDYLRADPDVSPAHSKETHFFDDNSIDWAAPDYERYHAQFDWDRHGLPGEATPIYIYWPNCLERIAAYNPMMRLIVLLRDPVERAWSHWKMEYGRGAETKPFSWCIRAGRARMLDAEPWGYHREFSYVERGYYGEQLERLFGFFPPERVLLLKSQDLYAKPDEALAATRRFLGLPARGPVKPIQSNVGRTPLGGCDTLQAEDVAFLRQIYARDMLRLKALTGISFE